MCPSICPLQITPVSVVNFDNFHFKDENRIRRNGRRSSLCPISQFGRDDQFAFLALTNTCTINQF